MKHLKLVAIPFVLLVVMAVLLLKGGFAHATPVSAASCGQWKIVNSPSVGSTSVLNAVAAVSANDVWAVGYTATNNKYQPLAEHWNGTSWSVVPTPKIYPGGILYGLAVISSNDIWAVGRDFIGLNGKGLTEHWNGTQWNFVKSPNVEAGSALFGVTAIASNNVWAVGYFNDTSNGSTSYTLVEHWNGTRWKVISSPTPINPIQNPLLSISALSANDIWAVGNGDYQTTLAEHWNGSQWSIVKSPNVGPNSQFTGVAAVSTNDVWAVGGKSKTVSALIEHWDGTKWSVFKNPGGGTSGAFLNGVTVLSASNVWAVGIVANSGNINQTFTEHWNGTKWNIVSSPNVGTTSNSLNAVAGAAGTTQLWAVGSYATSNGSNTLIESYC